MKSRIKITVRIENARPDGELTSTEQWDIITAAAKATRAAIEHYIEPQTRQKAIDAAAMEVRAPLGKSVKYGHKVVP